MKATVISASAIRSLKPRLLDSLSFDFYKKIKDKYHFEIAPNPQQIPTAGVPAAVFQYGKLKKGTREITIEQLNISYIDVRATSIGALTKTSTEDGSLFLDHLLEWAHRQFGIDTTAISPTFFHSQYEVVFEIPISKAFGKLEGLVKETSERLAEYGFGDHRFEIANFSMYTDTLNKQPPLPTPFVIERRVGAPYSENKFFSQAPLKSADHERVLRHFEKSLRA
jgi:hypothetical protein